VGSRPGHVRLATLGVGLAVIAMLSAACGSTGSGGSSGGSSPINVGAIVPLTGGNAVYGTGMSVAVKMAVKDVNQVGGPLGRQIKVYVQDDQSEPADDVTAAKKLVSVNHVVGVVGSYGSSQTLAAAPVVLKSNRILMNAAGAPEVFALGQLSFQFNPKEDVYGQVSAQTALANGWKTMAVMGTNNSSGKAYVESFKKAFVAGGGNLTSSTLFTPNQSDLSAELSRALKGNTDNSVAVYGYTPDCTVLLKNGLATGKAINWIGVKFGFNEEALKVLPNGSNQTVYGVDTTLNKKNSAYDTAASTYQSLAKSQQLSDNPYAAMAYDMVTSLALAIQITGKTDGPSIAAGLHKLADPQASATTDFKKAFSQAKSGKPVNFVGLSGPLNFAASDNSRSVFFGVFKNQNGSLELQKTIDTTKMH
jgi:ABC-type branched-subunit amino acid transport system substrate-binding protein